MSENNKEDLYCRIMCHPLMIPSLRDGRPGIEEEDKLQILSGGSQPLASSNEIKAELPCQHQNQSTLTLNLDA